MKAYIPTLLIILVFIAAPAAIWLERSERTVWNERLFLPSFFKDVNRHTPVHDIGTYLPPVISKNMHLTPEQNPILISGAVTVPKGVTLTIAPDVNMYVHEYGLLNVEGTLRIQGSTENPVILTTNEQHLENRTWSGIVFHEGSSGTISFAHIRHASPAVSCGSGSTVSIQNSNLSFGNVGIYTESNECVISNSVVESVQDGIIAVGVPVHINNTKIDADENETRIFE